MALTSKTLELNYLAELIVTSSKDSLGDQIRSNLNDSIFGVLNDLKLKMQGHLEKFWIYYFQNQKEIFGSWNSVNCLI